MGGTIDIASFEVPPESGSRIANDDSTGHELIDGGGGDSTTRPPYQPLRQQLQKRRTQSEASAWKKRLKSSCASGRSKMFSYSNFAGPGGKKETFSVPSQISVWSTKRNCALRMDSLPGHFATGAQVRRKADRVYLRAYCSMCKKEMCKVLN